MKFFPQLVTGSIAQYPLVKRAVYRTIWNTALDGSEDRLGDSGAERLEWELRYEGLSREEQERLATFHGEMEGRLGEFTFLDPTENLLARSGEPEASVWEKSPLLTVVRGIPDPAGGAEAFRLTNAAGVEQSLQQVITAPGWFAYCWSVYVRSETAARLTLYRKSGIEEDAKEFAVGTSWERLVHSGKGGSQETTVWFGVRLGPGAAVELYGMQAEAQPAPSPYRRTRARGGVYEGARFDDDELRVAAVGPDLHSCTVRIVRAGR
ncbi:MAG: hypothetical protein K6T61_11830 [Bryobacteraceae bacterium]|nr:hypothetical protein [Bryobacteraceae bacterium]